MANKLTVLIVGGGGREHALAWKLAQSPRLKALYAAPGNGGMEELAVVAPVPADDVAGQTALAREIGADLVVVGPELPLSLGLVDELRRTGIPAVGPTRAAARIESSKAFAKEVMRSANIPTAPYHLVDDVAAAEAIITAHFARGRFADVDLSGAPEPLVLKADGLAAGKGVVICPSEAEALAVARDMLSGRRLGGAGAKLLIEGHLTGPELSLLAFCDGRRAVAMPFVRDYKRLRDGDRGPNTGGMGSLSPVLDGDDRLHRELTATCVEPLLEEMARRGTPFRGVLFAGVMLTPEGPMVLEYNARFGDPETQSLVRRLDGDLLELLEATAAGDLSGVSPTWSPRAACCVVMAAKGYPDAPESGVVIDGLPAEESGDVVVFHGGTRRDGAGRLLSAGGRVLGVTAVGDDVDGAVARAYEAVGRISFPGGHYRTDIGRR